MLFLESIQHPTEWTEEPDLTIGRATHILGTLVDGSIAAFGGDSVTPDGPFTASYINSNGEWEFYDDIPEDMSAQDNGVSCMVQVGNSLYTLAEETIKLDLGPWGVQIFGETPFANNGIVGHCAAGTKGGNEGILIRDGNWLDAVTHEWTEVAKPPVPSSTAIYSIKTFCGRPTIFGIPECFDSDGDQLNDGCRAGTGVTTFDPDADSWTYLSDLAEPRLYHSVITMPSWVCTGEPPTTTTEVVITTESDFPSVTKLGETAALVIGGASTTNAFPNELLATAELFGCPRSDGPISVIDMPIAIAQAGGAFARDDENGHFAILCGGYQPGSEPESGNAPGADCYIWRPDGTWQQALPLNAPR